MRRDGQLTPTQLALLATLKNCPLQLGRGGGATSASGAHFSGITVKRMVAKRLARYEGAYGLHITDAGLGTWLEQTAKPGDAE